MTSERLKASLPISAEVTTTTRKVSEWLREGERKGERLKVVKLKFRWEPKGKRERKCSGYRYPRLDSRFSFISPDKIDFAASFSLSLLWYGSDYIIYQRNGIPREMTVTI